ncbi:MAG: alpha-amylase, partial [Turicibacter sp.]|nr:alpha-amylase [Turicibacter sp.]
KRVAIFNFGLKSGEISVHVPDGEYEDLMNHEMIAVYNGKIRLSAEPIIFDLKK